MSQIQEIHSVDELQGSALGIIKSRVLSKTATLGIVGLGYVGLPLAMASCNHGIKTIGFDLNQEKIGILLQKKSFLQGVSDSDIKKHLDQEIFSPSSNLNDLKKADFILLCVPTPLTKNHTPDMSYIESACQMIATILRPGQVIILESTTYPGTTTEVMIPLLEESGLVCGYDFFVAYSPEREDPGNAIYSTHTIPKIVGADQPELCDIVAQFYGYFIKNVIKVSSTRTAEAVKLLENIFRYVNIGLVNELKMVFDDMNIDMNEVVTAAATKPFGFMPFYPGPGIGGHCIPIDPLYLTWKTHEYKSSTRFIQIAMEINQKMPVYTVQKFSEQLNDIKGKAVNKAKILLIGLAYKKNISDLRESPASDIISSLKKRSADLYYYDPFIDSVSGTEYDGLKPIKWTVEQISKMDGAIIITDHDGINWQTLIDNCCVIYDSRNVIKKYQS